ncbi:MAG: M56 family metallopeptidase, partial [Planctomycetaceae bacterium]|nr:M56 family metallopeptidase [Planctomycetaceae bacterium]
MIHRILEGPCWDNAFDWWAIVLLHSLWTGAGLASLVAILHLWIPRQSVQQRYLIAVSGLLLVPLTATGAKLLFAENASQPSDHLQSQLAGAGLSPDAAQESSLEKVSTFDRVSADQQPANSDTTAVHSGHRGEMQEQLSGQRSPVVRAKENGEHLTLPWKTIRRFGVIVWLVGFGFMLIRLLRSHLGALQLQRQAATPVPDWLQRLFDQLVRSYRVRSGITLRLAEKLSGPMVCGLLRPVILLPAAAVLQLSPEALQVVLCHELAHICRRDLLISFLERVLECCFFFNPAVWWICRRVRAEREAACDAMAVQLTSGPLAVAAALLDT